MYTDKKLNKWPSMTHVKFPDRASSCCQEGRFPFRGYRVQILTWRITPQSWDIQVDFSSQGFVCHAMTVVYPHISQRQVLVQNWHLRKVAPPRWRYRRIAVSIISEGAPSAVRYLVRCTARRTTKPIRARHKAGTLYRSIVLLVVSGPRANALM